MVEKKDTTVALKMLLASGVVQGFEVPKPMAHDSELMAQLDFVIGKIFTNITLKDGALVSYQLNSPFKEFVEKGFVVFGRGDRT